MAISKEYRSAVGKLNRARGKKSGDKGYITPKQALQYPRKYKDVAAVEKAIEKVKTDKQLKKYAKQYNRFMEYKPGDAGYITLSQARSIGVPELEEYAAFAEQVYGEEIRRAELNRAEEIKRRRIHTRRVNQSIKDEEKLREKAQSVLDVSAKYNKLNEKLEKVNSEAEYISVKSEVQLTADEINKKFGDFKTYQQELHNKYRKMNKLPESTSDLHLERYSIKNKIDEANEALKKPVGKDEYGNPTTIYTIYRDKVNAAVSVILEAAMSTSVGIEGKVYTLSDIIQTTHIDNEKFWATYHVWEKNGGDFLPAKGRKHSDEVTASKFFASSEGYDLLQTMLKGEFKGKMLIWDVKAEEYEHGKKQKK